MVNKNTGLATGEISLKSIKKSLEPYTLDYVAKISKGNPDEDIEEFKKKLQTLADLYIEKIEKLYLSGQWNESTHTWNMGKYTFI